MIIYEIFTNTMNQVNIYSLSLFCITPILGIIRNYCKNKQINKYLILRSNIIYLVCIYFFKFIQYNYSIYEILIYERWIMFCIKIIISIYNDDYNTKKQKYIQKYNIKYN